MTARLTITAHGIPLYNDFATNLFDSYLPLMYGGLMVQSPVTVGAMMINFALYPGTYQPSGHINVSRAREFYLTYTSAYDSDGSTYLISSSNPGQMYICASAINFLLVTDGSAVLRYST